MTTSPMPAAPSTSSRRRALSVALASVLAIAALLALGASLASADAGNPIVGTTQGELVQNPDGTVTAYIRGQWNWLSHNSDCNTDRAATGLSMIWNDPTETGYTLTKGAVSASVGVASKNGSWADPNPIDGMVHPVDRGNVPEALPGLAGQTFNDPAPQAAGETHPTATWRGGCGREPLNHADAYTGHPWGSWGYEKSSLGSDGNTHLGYSHVYRSRDFVPKSICVNFYDVHGGGSVGNKSFQVASGNKELDVLENGDNSIETNTFDVNGGSCVHFAKVTTTAVPTAKLGEPIHDTAQITNAFTNGTSVADGTITFKAYKDPTTCTGAALFTSGPTPVDLDKSSEVSSENFTPGSAGTYYWVATYHSTADPQATDISTTCKEAGETSVVTPPGTPMLVTDSTNGNVNGNIHTVGSSVHDTATLSGIGNNTYTGTLTFKLFDNETCDASGSHLVATVTKAVTTGDGSYDSPSVTINTAGKYWWVASFESSTLSVTNAGPTQCNDPKETESINKAEPAISTNVSKGEITVGENVPNDTAHLSGLVNPQGTRSITFSFYDNAGCNGVPFTETTIKVTSNGDYSTNVAVPTDHTGTYYWAASYSGDTNNTTAETGCSDATEQVVVKKGTPKLSTNATQNAIVGENIQDVATLSSLAAPTGAGAVTFDLYKGADCSGAKLATLSATPASVTANGNYTSESFNTTSSGAGSYHWVAHYSGDANNNAVDGVCLANGENTTVEKATPQLSTNATQNAIVGQSIQDVATLTGLVNATGNGSVTFDLYKGADCSGAKLATLSATPALVNSNGTYTSQSFDTTNSGAGAYHWIAHYTGDANNKAVDGTCLASNENTTVEKATPQLSTNATQTATVGQSISDVATLSGLVNATGNGSVTFDLYKGTDCSGAKLATLNATPATVAANGNYTSQSFDTTNSGAGSYHWIAHYSGDANNKAADGTCLANGENTTVEKATPNLSTNATQTAIVGQNISDVATLSGLVNATGAGSVTFDLYKGTDCSGAKLATLAGSPASVTANGNYTSENFNTTNSGAGSYHWIAHYSGDANNKAADGTCLANGENTTVEKATPNLSTNATQTAVVGQNIQDVATLSGLVNATGAGSVTFDLYKGTDCSGAKLATLSSSPAAVNANGNYTSQSFDTTNTGAGSYHWIAHYSGDANNKAADGTCLANGENTTVEKATPNLSTNATQTAVVGQSIQDVATLSGLVGPTGAGAVTFDLYKGADCSGGKLATLTASPASVNANGNYTSQSFDTTNSGAGSYHWVAHYSGDANNNPADGTCLANGENTTVEKGGPNLSTDATQTATVGQSIQDVATLTGLVSPTGAGAVTFDLYKGNDCSGAKLAVLSATPASVNSNGTYTSQSFDTTNSGAGSYHWVAHYSGDANNKAADGTCLALNENTTVEKASPNLSTNATQTAIVGQNISDVATLSGLVNPTGAGAVTFDLYKGADCSGAKLAVLSATPASVNSNGNYTSQNFDTTSTGAGSYHWIAHYSGDANNKAVDGTCLALNENTTVEKATPNLSTNATQTAIVGQNISDVATLSGLVNATGTGSVTFDLYKGTDCSGAKLATLNATPALVNSNGNYTSENFNTTNSGAGSYHWVAHYSGDANNKAVDGVCLANNENTTVEKATPNLSTNATQNAIVGQNISDVATLSGLVNATGTGSVTFDLYKGTDCSGAKLATLTATPAAVNGNGNYTSQNFDTSATGAGSYHWIAHYSGDANNKAVDGACLDNNENTNVERFTPQLSTNATQTAIVGEDIKDVATLSGLVGPTGAGAVTFDLYKGADCSGAKLATLTATPASVNANGNYTSQSYNTTSSGAGSYHWVAHYSGDANNKPVDGVCLANNENTTVEKATPNLSTNATKTAIVGQSIQDVATLSGLVNATGAGAVTFDLYKGADCSGAKLATLTATPASVNSNGNYTSQSFDTTSTGPGSYHWVAHYSGDANNKAADGVCLADNENTTVEKITPALTTTAGPGGVLGVQVTDTAHLSGGVNPTGTITFVLYNNPTCSGTPAGTVANGSVNGNGDYSSPPVAPTAAGDYYWVASYSGDANNEPVHNGCSDASEKVTITPPVQEVKAEKEPPRVCKLRKARARVFVYTRHNKVRLVIRYVAYTKAKITTSYTMHGKKGKLFLGSATQTFKKKGLFRLPKRLTRHKMNKIRAASEFDVQFKIPGTPNFCKHYFKRKLTIPKYIEGQRVWFQTGSVFGGDV